MRKITDKEYKEVLVDLLVHFDKICRKNNIKYSLIGGSLIGAIRHGGIIPWDDDIDVILMPEEYEKLMLIKEQFNDETHLFMDMDSCSDYYFTFPKLVDTRTKAHEKGTKKITNYGIYMDIFRYNYMPNDLKFAEKAYKRFTFVKRLFMLSYITNRNHTILKRVATFFLKRINYKNWGRMQEHNLHPRNTGKKYILSNWPTYSFEKELQLSEDFDKYTDHNFENHKVMITKSYDRVLRTTFGDYMTPPPQSERRKQHQLEAYWK